MRLKYFNCYLILLLITLFSATFSVAMEDENPMSFGIPLGSVDDNLDICPEGVKVVTNFINAWGNEDYLTMYSLIDDSSKDDFSYEDAKFNFQFLEFKKYKISQIRRIGEDFEFFLTYGDWKFGDKDVRKLIISGSTFKIIMPNKNSPFKKSLESYLN